MRPVRRFVPLTLVPLLAAALLPRPAAAPRGATVPAAPRPVSGRWVLRMDPGDRGLAAGWPRRRFAGRPVRVPYVPGAAVVRGAAGWRNFQGSVAWYATTIRVRETGDYALRFESVNHHARVWIDGRLVARHTGTYLPFEARARLAAGPHRVVVRADWHDPKAMQRAGWHRTWFNFGGVNRPVTLRRLGPSELDSPGIVTRLDRGGALVAVTVRVRNRSRPRVLQVRGDVGGSPLRFPPVRLAGGRAAWVQARVRIPHPDLWAPGHPALQALRLWVPGEASTAAKVGLRELRWDRGRLCLNGRPLHLRGASLQEDAPGRGDAETARDMDRTVAELRAIGANATRAQHPLNSALLDRLDAAGILVWQGVGALDAPGRWTARTPARLRVQERRVRLAVLPARIHPSVLAWTLVNELAFNGRPTGERTYVRRGAALLHRLDPGRPVAVDVWGTHLPARAGAVYRDVDAVGATDYEGWYADLWAPRATVERRIRAWLRRLHAVFTGKPLVVTEFGAEGDPRNPAAAPGGYRFQARLLASHVHAYADDGRLSGMLAWSLRDFAMRPNFLGGSVRSQDRAMLLQRGINEKGVFTFHGRPKPAAATLARLYRSASRARDEPAAQ